MNYQLLLISSAKSGSLGFLKDALKDIYRHNISIDVKGPRGNNALHEAASQGHLGIVVELVKAGADINVKNNKGLTALQIARRKGHKDVVKFLEKYILFQVLYTEKNLRAKISEKPTIDSDLLRYISGKYL
jgi:ankyrin repeat protein